MERREFLRITGATALGVSPFGRALAQVPTRATATLKIGSPTGVTMPRDFVGLSYESAQLAHPEFFSPRNTALVAMFLRLGKRGVLRLGGNTSEFTQWSATDAVADTTLPPAVNPDTGQQEKPTSIITPRAIRNLRGFLDATGWDCIYGLNLGRGTPEQAAAESAFVVPTLGTKLIALQIGNEPNLYGRHFRPQPYSFSEYISDWEKFAVAVRQRVPGAKFAGPDVAGDPEWVREFAAQHSPDTVMLTSHYYAEGPPTDPRMNIDFLLHPTPALLEALPIVMQAAHRARLPYRMAEGNSCYWGGKPGVSDVFAATLWSGDYMLQLAQAGCVGVNLHGGGTGVYTPIAGSISTGFTERPVFHGMQFALKFAGTQFLNTQLNAGGQNVTAYATRGHGTQLAIFNKSEAFVALRLEPSRPLERVAFLRAPSIDAKEHVTFAEIKPRSAQNYLELPPYSAAYVELV